MAPAWMDEEGDNTVREEGTACHHFAHLAAIGQPANIGDIAPNSIAFDVDMRDAVAWYLDAINKWSAPQISFEVKLPVPGIGEGTPDAAAIGWFNGVPCIYIADLKYGYRTVDVWPNFQLILYSFAVARAHGLDISQCYVSMTIVQPRRWHHAGIVRTAFVRGSELVQYVTQAIAAVALARQPDAPLKPGKHCDYCPGRAQCQALRNDVLNEVVAMPEALPFEYAESELLHLRKYSEKLAAYMSGLEAQIEHGIKSGKRSTKFEMRKAQGRKVWTDPAKIKALAKLIGVNIEKPADLITPNQAFAAGLPAEFINTYATRAHGKTTLEIADSSKWAKVFGK